MLTPAACGGAPSDPPRSTPAAEAPEPLHDGALADYIPAAGINWVVLAKPSVLNGNRAFMNAIEPLLPASRLELYARDTKLDLRGLSSAAVVGFDLGILYMAETDTDLTPATRAFEERLITAAEVKHPHPRLTRVSGVVGKTPESLLRYDGKLLAVAVGDTTTVRIVEAFARKKLKRSPSLFGGVALRSFRDFGKDAPVAFFAPGPFEGRWIYGGAGLMAAATALGIALEPSSDGRQLKGTLAIDGPWQDSDAEPVARIREAWQALAESSTGRLFGLHEPRTPPVFEASDTRIRMDVWLELEPVVEGLRAAVSADVWEMLDVKPTSTSNDD